MNEYVNQVKKNISVLDISIQEMEMQIYNDCLMYTESVERKSYLERLRSATISTIESLKARLNHPKDTPVEIWTKIFGFRVDAEMQDFFDSLEPKVFPLVALRLSHVCRAWRDAILSDKCLWHCVPAYANQGQKNSKIEFMNYLGKIGATEARHLV